MSPQRFERAPEPNDDNRSRGFESPDTNVHLFSRLLWTAKRVPNWAAPVRRLRAPKTPAEAGKGEKIWLPRHFPLLPLTSNIVILAALPNPAGTDTGNETVILGNQGNDDQDLAGWKLTDDDGGSFALDGLSIPARGSLTVTLNDSLQLGNQGDEITLRNPSDQAASVLKYNVAENGRFVARL